MAMTDRSAGWKEALARALAPADDTPRVIRRIFKPRGIGTFCTESVWERSSQTLWIHPSFAPHLLRSRCAFRTALVGPKALESRANRNLVGVGWPDDEVGGRFP